MSLLPPDANANIARHLPLMAGQQPARAALKVPRGRTRSGEIEYLSLSFAELAAEVDAWSARLTAAGVRPGDRTLVMVRQGLPLIASAFALFQIGAVPVIIDPGMGLKTFLACVQRSGPRALVGIPLAQLVSRLFRRAFGTVAVRVAASGSLTARLPAPTAPGPKQATAMCGPADLAAILFTSGSTGTPKGVCYEHGMFDAQVRIIRETYAIEPGEIDLPMLPIFALFNPALGLTTIVPEIDPRRPADVDPRRIVQAIRQEAVTNSFGSPTLWRIIGEYCLAEHLTLPGLRRVLCAGAPVPSTLWQSARVWMPNGRLHSPYGATEALPVSTISGDEMLSLHPAHSDAADSPDDKAAPAQVAKPTMLSGACVGRPVARTRVKIIAITDAPIETLADARELPSGEIGEIIVSGPTVTRVYDADPAATAAAKIQAPSDTDQHPVPAGSVPDPFPGTTSLAVGVFAAASAAPVWHRMGDCGYLDADGRLWFCGRKAERVVTPHGTLFTEPCENVFRAHPRIARCALIGLGERGQQRPAIVVETQLKDSHGRRTLTRELRALARGNPHTVLISLFYFHPHFPVDVRHNAKIHRLALARWAATARGDQGDPQH